MVDGVSPVIAIEQRRIDRGFTVEKKLSGRSMAA
jgi:hypothetical protein